MNRRQPPENDDERLLRAAFDATAEEASGALLTRLRARAADVPAHVRRRPRFIPRWAWAPGFAGAGVALAALVVTFGFEWGDPAPPAPNDTTGVEPPIAPAPARVELSAPPTVLPPAPDAALTEEPAEYYSDSDWIDGDSSDARSLDPLDGLAADEDLDAWLFATARLAQEGG